VSQDVPEILNEASATTSSNKVATSHDRREEHSKYEQGYWARDSNKRILSDYDIAMIEKKKLDGKSKTKTKFEVEASKAAESLRKASWTSQQSCVHDAEILPEELMREHRMVREQLEKTQKKSKEMQYMGSEEHFTTVVKKQKQPKNNRGNSEGGTGSKGGGERSLGYRGSRGGGRADTVDNRPGVVSIPQPRQVSSNR